MTSRGLGDTIANITEATGLDKLAELYESITGQPCGCSTRQEALNKLIPYGNQTDTQTVFVAKVENNRVHIE